MPLMRTHLDFALMLDGGVQAEGEESEGEGSHGSPEDLSARSLRAT
jgi:hypothetical protein